MMTIAKLKVDIGKLDKRITIQRHTISEDEYGNQVQEWVEYHKCWAAVNGVTNREYWQAREQHEENIVNFRVRFCNLLKDLNKTEYRIVFDGRIYDISYVDNVLYADSLLNIKGAEIT